MAVRRDEVQLDISFITDESKTLAKTLQTTKAYNDALAESAAKIKIYQKELVKVGADEVKRAPILAKISLEEQKIAVNLGKIAIEGKKVEGLDLNKVAPAQLVERAKQLEQALKLIPQSAPAFRELQGELAAVNTRLAAIRAESRGVAAGVTDAATGTSFLQRVLSTAVGVLGGLNLNSLIDQARQWVIELFNVGVGLDAAQQKTETVFGEATAIVQGFAETNARSLGLARQEYVNLATSAGDLLKPMGFTEEAAARLSVTLTDQAGVLSEWTQGKITTNQASEILTKALLGERDALNSLGIDIKDAVIQDEIKRKGLEALTGASRRQAEALITLEQITQQSASANAAFEKNTDSLVRKKAELRARIAEVSQTAANLLIPVFSAALSAGLKLIDWGVRFAQTLAAIPRFVSENRVAIGLLITSLIALNAQGILAAANALRLAAAQQAATIATNAQAVAQRLLNLAMNANPIGLVISAVSALAAIFVTAYQKSETFRRIVAGTFEAITAQVQNAIGFFSDLGKGLVSLFQGDFQAAGDAFSNAFTRLNAFEVGSKMKDAFVKGYASVPPPKAEVQADEPAARAEGSKVGAALAAGFEGEFDRLQESGERGADALTTAAKTALDARLKEIEASFLKEELVTDRALFTKEISEAEHGKRILELKQRQYLDQITAFRTFHAEETKEAFEAQKKLLEVQQQLSSQGGVAPIAPLATRQPGQVTSQTATVTQTAAVTSTDEQIRIIQEKTRVIIETEQQGELLRLDLMRTQLEERLRLLQEAGLQETTAYKQALDDKTKADEAYNAKKIENDQRTAELKRKIEQESLSATSDFFGAFADLLSQDEKARKKNAGAIKAFQTAQVIVDGIKEVQSIWAHAADLGPIAGPIIGALLTAVAVGRSVIAINKINSTKFERGTLIREWNTRNRYGRGAILDFGSEIPKAERGSIWKFWTRGNRYERGGVVGSDTETPKAERGSIWKFWKRGNRYERGGVVGSDTETPKAERGSIWKFWKRGNRYERGGVVGSDTETQKATGGTISTRWKRETTVEPATMPDVTPLPGPAVRSSSTQAAMNVFVKRLYKETGASGSPGIPKGKFGYFGGKPHSAGGTKGYFEDGTNIEVERNEAFVVVNKKNAPMLRFLSRVNAHGGHGVPFFQKGGAFHFAGGGIAPVNTNPVPATVQVPEAKAAADMSQGLIEEIRGLRADVANWNTSLRANVVYQDIENAGTELNTIRDDAAI